MKLIALIMLVLANKKTPNYQFQSVPDNYRFLTVINKKLNYSIPVALKPS